MTDKRLQLQDSHDRSGTALQLDWKAATGQPLQDHRDRADRVQLLKILNYLKSSFFTVKPLFLTEIDSIHCPDFQMLILNL
jgi:hypothetical protein